MLMHRFIRRAALAVTLLALPTVAFAQKETETVERTLAFPSGGLLKLKNFSGDIRVTAASGRNFVMKAVRRATRERLDGIKLDIQTSGSTIEVNANQRSSTWERRNDNVVETTFEIQIPADATLDIDGFSSEIDVIGIIGSQALTTFSGSITVTGAKAIVRAESFSGDIEVDATGQGNSPELDLETFSGSMRAKLAEGARGEVEFNSFSGGFDAAFPVTLSGRSSRRNIRVELPGGAGRTLRFKSFSGDLRIMR